MAVQERTAKRDAKPMYAEADEDDGRGDACGSVHFADRELRRTICRLIPRSRVCGDKLIALQNVTAYLNTVSVRLISGICRHHFASHSQFDRTWALSSRRDRKVRRLPYTSSVVGGTRST